MFPILANLEEILKRQYKKTSTAWQWGWRIHPHPDTGHVRSWHNGIDLPDPVGTPIYSPLAGKVEHVHRTDDGASGKFLRISHSDPRYPNITMTRYAHLSDIPSNIKVGTQVKEGQLVAYVGNTGRSTGPHLHYIINQKTPQDIGDKMRTDIDPLPYLEESLGKYAVGGIGIGLALVGLLYWWYSKH